MLADSEVRAGAPVIDIALVLSILGGFTVFMTAMAGMRKLGKGIGTATTYIQALDKIPDIQGLQDGQAEIKSSLTSLTESVSETRSQLVVIADIREIVANFKEAVRSLADNASDMAVVTFKAHTIHCPTASYIIATSQDGLGVFEWANPIWYELHGIGYAEAMTGQFWASIADEDKARVRAASDSAAASRSEFRVTYTNVNAKTGKRTKCEVQAWPLVPYNVQPGDQVRYLGAIKEFG